MPCPVLVPVGPDLMRVRMKSTILWSLVVVSQVLQPPACTGIGSEKMPVSWCWIITMISGVTPSVTSSMLTANNCSVMAAVSQLSHPPDIPGLLPKYSRMSVSTPNVFMTTLIKVISMLVISVKAYISARNLMVRTVSGKVSFAHPRALILRKSSRPTRWVRDPNRISSAY